MPIYEINDNDPKENKVAYYLLQNGADYNEWDLMPLKKDIDKLMGQTEYILLDYPFAYKNKLIASYIDISVYIDTPLDVAINVKIKIHKNYQIKVHSLRN